MLCQASAPLLSRAPRRADSVNVAKGWVLVSDLICSFVLMILSELGKYDDFLRLYFITCPERFSIFL